MRNLSILISTFFLFFLLQHIATYAQIYTSLDNVALDCGTSTSGHFAAPDGRKWTMDKIGNYTALENVHRLNIDGRSIPAMGDRGMYRNWYDDFFYLVTASVVSSNTSIKLDYSIIHEYTTPDAVYRTAKSIGSNKIVNLSYNLTWRLAVDLGFRYLVRLHFCEFDPLIEVASDRRFSIYIDNKIAATTLRLQTKVQVVSSNNSPKYEVKSTGT
ncbi:hypothetical protein CRYUN_Cryun24cG0092000 [Craigia yunnanensis]